MRLRFAPAGRLIAPLAGPAFAGAAREAHTRLGRRGNAAAARAKFVSLTKEADARSFQGVRESISDFIRKSSDPAEVKEP